MQNLISRLIAAAAAIVVAGPVSAGIVPVVYSQSQSFSGDANSVWNFEFDQFNEDVIPVPLGFIPIIKSIVITLESTMSAHATAENLGIEPSPGVTIVFSGFAAASMPGAQASVAHFIQAASGGIAGSDGVPGSGPDFYDFGVLSDSSSDQDKIFGNSGEITHFIGDGTFPVDVTTSGGFAFGGDQAISVSVLEFMIEGTVTVDIHYNIPAPSTAAILLAAPMFIGRRRR